MPSEPNLTPSAVKSCPWYQPLCQVTPVSKYLAMVIFIAAPFVGGYIGHQFAPVKVVEVPVPVSPLVTESEPVPDFRTPEVPNQKIAVTKNILYVASEKDFKSYYEDGYLGTDKKFNKTLILKDVHVVDTDSLAALELPFLHLIATTSDGYIFTLPCFGASECGDSGLYKYRKEQHTLQAMQGSKSYYPMLTGDVWSPDRTKIAVNRGFTLGVIDLMNDTFTNVKTFTQPEHKIFSMCEMGCVSNMAWKDNQTLKADVYEYTSCDTEGFCQSTITEKDGTQTPSTAPIRTLTVEFKIN